ncbi:MAG: hypothetical protein CL670_01825 [Balneola sp.]|mgnify:CR=1 FL=1|jgi:hypothetical protein|nr:hypothetical protein [Balneola sp.]MBE77874.1 hypothetical protein [Balneola sp.]HBX65445.1 hypothetical protein [Balneolaceae bacterium]|tara:strand:- start:279 stop:1328 length:1050 start_codon:yes stop_codon:yes gene_type:complete
MRFNLILFLSVLLAFIGCSSEDENKTPSSSISISLADSATTHVLKDDMTFLGSIAGIDFLDENRLIISDNSPGVYLFEDYEMVASYGGIGKGPCEFEQVSAFDTFENTLYVLDQSLTKLIYFDIETQECIEEVTHEDFGGVLLLRREENSPSFILGRTSYTGFSNDSLPLAYRFYDDKTSEALDFTLGRVNAISSMVMLRSSGMNFEKHDNSLYGYYPMTDSLYSINLDDYSVNSIPLDIDIQRDEIEAAGEDFNKIIEIIQTDFEFMDRYFISDQWVGIQVVHQAASEEEEATRILKFFTHRGDFIKEIPSTGKTIAFHNGQLVELYEGQNPNSDYVYSIGFRDIITN